MVYPSPLRGLHETLAGPHEIAGASRPGGAVRPGAASGRRLAVSTLETIGYGPAGEPGGAAGEVANGEAALGAIELVATYGPVQLEYATIRRGCAIMDCPHRGTLVVSGKERRDFLNRMLTADCAALATPGRAVRSFWLNRKGRVQADLLVAEMGERIVMSLDAHDAAATAASLNEFIFAEDVSIADASGAHHHVGLHGPQASAVLAAVSEGERGELKDLEAEAVTIAGVGVTVLRNDQCGVPGFELIVPATGAAAVWNALMALEAGGGAVRAIGWHAYNIARIEAGTPLFNIDFGRTSLPHETGVLRERVSFTKGCYLGQEIVARMESLGQPKQMLVGLRVRENALPVAGAQVFAGGQAQGEGSGAREGGEIAGGGEAGGGAHLESPVGVVTSSTLAPMLSSQPVAFATIRTAHAAPGTRVVVNAEGRQAVAEVSPLGFLPNPRNPDPWNPDPRNLDPRNLDPQNHDPGTPEPNSHTEAPGESSPQAAHRSS